MPIAWYPQSTYSVVAGHVARVVREQVRGGGADVVGVDRAVQRRALLDDRLHRREAGDRARGERAHGPGRDGVHADVLLAEVPGEVPHGRVERRLGDAHHVVVRHRALAAEVGHRQDRAAARGLHQRLRRARAGDERVGADVERHPEAVARRVGEAALEILRRREGDRVHEQVELPAERLAHLAEDARDVLVGADVALGDERASTELGELADALLDPLALVGERELRAALGEPPRDRPGDRAPVGDAEHEAALAFELPAIAGESKSCGSAATSAAALRRPSLLSLVAALLVLARRDRLRRAPADPPAAARRAHAPARARTATLKIPRGQRSGRVRVLVGLRLPPLAQRYGPRPRRARAAQAARHRAARASRAYLARARRRARPPAAAQLRRADPERAHLAAASGSSSTASTVSLPLPRPAAAAAAAASCSKVYPSLRYHLDTNKSPSVIRADTFWASDRRRAATGIKIGVVDDGVDQTNPFFNPAGFSYPRRLPEGRTKWTTPKVIVARAFPGPGSGAAGTPGARPARLVPRHARGRDRRRRRRHDARRPRPRPSARRPACPASRPARGSGTTASSTCPRRLRPRRLHARDRRRLRGGRARRDGRDQLLRRRPRDRPGQRRADRGGRTTSPRPASCR